MKQNFLKLIFAIFLFLNVGLAFAGQINHFKVTVNPTKAGVGEAIDLIIEAVDRDGNTVTDYEGTVLIFSESDREAQFPNALEDNSYTFKASDEGVRKFENAVKFNNKGTNDIHVYDLDDQTDSLMGLAEVEITDKVEVKKVDISILSPETGLTIGGKSINVSGKTEKNHQVKIVLNGKDEILTTSNTDGIFEKEIENLVDGENIIKAFVLDGDDKELGASKEIKISINANLPIFNKLILTPNGDSEIEAEAAIQAEVYASKGLSKVSVILDDGINDLVETTEGVYKGEFLAPKLPGEYKIDILLKDELGHKSKEENKASLIIKEKTESAGIPEPVESEPVEPEPVEPAVIVPEPKIKDNCVEGDKSGDLYDGKCLKEENPPIKDNCIQGDESGDLYDGKCLKEVVQPIKDKCTQGDYSGDVYDGKCGTKPVDYSAPVDLNVKNLRLVKLKTKTVLTWDYLPDASKYEIYKATEGFGQPELIQTVKEPKFVFYMSSDKINFDHFAVKAVGKKIFTDASGQQITKDVTGDLSQAVRIQTGPKEILLVLLALLLGIIAVVFMRKKA